MSSVKGVVLGVCAASLVLGAVYMLRPSGAVTEKSIRFAFAVIFLSVTVLSVSALFKKEFRQESLAADNTYIESAAEIVSAQAEYLTGEILQENNIEFKKISVLTDKTENGDIFIKRITVVSGEDFEKVREYITSVIETNGVEVIDE
jgi:hypothetical protein